jgi:hypothetical protein
MLPFFKPARFVLRRHIEFVFVSNIAYDPLFFFFLLRPFVFIRVLVACGQC